MLSFEEILSLDYRCATDEAIRLARLVEAKVQAKQAKQIEELSAALAVKDEALRDYHNATGLYVPALALQPHADILNKIRANAVREGLTEWEGTTEPIYKFMHEYADRIEKGESRMNKCRTAFEKEDERG